MKSNLFDTTFNNNLANIWLLLLRISIGALMMNHGLPKLAMLLEGGDIQFLDWLGLGPTVSLTLAVIAEVVCSAFIILGLATRLAVIPLIITMLTAIFVIHANDPFAKQEFPLLYMIIYITLLVFGSGKFSIDQKMNRKGYR
ncbi:DoxX family protein [Fulvivirga sediminis]|uniref:DoxX family protein n=1 Tax=Fulvivirga sediminis TaxID=2803949 RepID=A0A937FBM4_9BACT|nr:DoxX family protein [Fulvivirga sediminis]MBL3658672.1 DoxX family protein [Fulvivirga sediminis]